MNTPKTAERIVAEFEFRRSEEKKARRLRIARRSMDIAGIIGVTAFVIYLSQSKGASSPAPVLICVYLISILPRLWTLEDEVKRLKEGNEKKA
jgi:hypothetical protein